MARCPGSVIDAARPAGEADGVLVTLGCWSARHRLLVLVLTLLSAGVAVFAGQGAQERFSAGAGYPPNAEAVRADSYLARHFRAGSADLVLTVHAPDGIDAPVTEQAGRRLTAVVRGADPVYVRSYWQTKEAALRDRTGRTALIVAKLREKETDALKAYRHLAPRLTERQGDLVVRATGTAPVAWELTQLSRRDQVRAELITAVPIILLLRIVVRSWLWTLLPAVVGACAVLVTEAVLKALSAVIDISVFATGIATALAFALAVDYSLFLVLRHREELHGEADTRAALRTTMRTAGRTVTVSALIVALSMAAFLLFPSTPLRSVGLAGSVTVLLVAVGALLIVPAGLSCLGPRIINRTGRRPSRLSTAFWDGLNRRVNRRPLPVALITAGLLAVVMLPFLRVSFGLTDDRALPTSAGARQAADEIRRATGTPTAAQPVIVLPGRRRPPTTHAWTRTRGICRRSRAWTRWLPPLAATGPVTGPETLRTARHGHPPRAPGFRWPPGRRRVRRRAGASSTGCAPSGPPLPLCSAVPPRCRPTPNRP